MNLLTGPAAKSYVMFLQLPDGEETFGISTLPTGAEHTECGSGGSGEANDVSESDGFLYGIFFGVGIDPNILHLSGVCVSHL